MGRIYYKGDTANLYMEIKGRRQVHAVFPKNEGGNFPGIYRLSFGDKFYIGRSYNIRRRVREHIQALERILSKNNKNHYQKGMLKFLIENPDFFLMEVKILEHSSNMLEEREQYWVDKYIRNRKVILNSYLVNH